MSGMNWKRAKFVGKATADLLDGEAFHQRDAAARWLKQNDKQVQTKSKKKPRQRQKNVTREAMRHGPVDRQSGLVVYTDGACEPNPGRGGWGFVVYRDGEEIFADSGGDIDATNNTMEMTGVMKALAWLLAEEGRGFAKIFSDSQYVVKGCNEWRHSWKKRGWQRAVNRQGKLEPVKNVDLWRRIDGLLLVAKVKIEWVKGHVGIIGNERADELSNLGRAMAIEEERRYSLIEEQLRVRA